MKISELASLSQVSIRSIRHYENQGLLEARRLENGYRDFSESAVERVKAIRLYLRLGLTTEEIGTLFKTEVAEPDEYEYCEEMLATYHEKLRNVNGQIEALQQWKGLLEKQIANTVRRKNNLFRTSKDRDFDCAPKASFCYFGR